MVGVVSGMQWMEGAVLGVQWMVGVALRGGSYTVKIQMTTPVWSLHKVIEVSFPLFSLLLPSPPHISVTYLGPD